MERRNFIKNAIISSAGMIFVPAFSKAGLLTDVSKVMINLQELERSFKVPPDGARPWVFYMWMNGNITMDGITADLEAMKRMGIGGAICFNSAVGIPRGPVDYAGEDWMAATVHTMKEAQRLGLEFAIHNSPGYSGCGGPWVTPDMSMQQLVWTETLVSGKADVVLAKPYAKQNYYRDAFVVAYPALAAEKVMMKDKLLRITVGGKTIDKSILTDGNPETKIRVEASADAPAVIQLDFAEAFEIRALSILRKAEVPHDLFDGPRDHPPVFLIEVSSDGISYKKIAQLNMPALREMDTPGALSFPAVEAKYIRLHTSSSTWVSDIHFYAGPRLGGWPGKLNYTGGSTAGETPAIQAEELIDPNKVIDISDKMDLNGRLQWDAPEGRWTILRIGHTTTGEECAAHPDAGKGLEIDKLRKDALELHFSAFLDKLINRLKPQIGKGFKGITVDSWEAGKQNWTADFPAAFKQRKTYDILNWMPAMTGRIVGSVMETERFLWDVRQTQAGLLSENFYGHYQKMSHDRGLEFYAEPYGDGTFDSLQVAQNLDVVMSEFWTRYIYGSDETSKQAASAAHIYGKKIVAAESFTAMPATSKWTDYPYSLKAEGDYFFTLGVNRLVFHTFVHQPYFTAKPAMMMGPFGIHMDRNNSWAEQAYGWTDYLKRTQHLLQQGLFIADVCYLKGDEPASGIPNIYPLMPEGITGDVIGPDALKRMSIKDGSIFLPDGMNYRVCILAKLDGLLLETLVKLKDLVAAGMLLIVSNRPQNSLGRQHSNTEIQSLVAELYGKLDGKSVKQVIYKKGKLIWSEDLSVTFAGLAIKPDFVYTAEQPGAVIHYIHKKVEGMEYYFLSNHLRRPEKIQCSFRVAAMQPEIWNSETGEIYDAGCYEISGGRLNIPLELSSAGALFVVFRKKISQPGLLRLTKDGKIITSVKSYPIANATPYTSVKDNFGMVLWAKPDSFAHNGKSMLFHASAGEELYGKGHAVAGLGAGQNGIFVYECSNGAAKQRLAVNQSLQGWTHIALVYEDGNPSIYINGKLAGKSTELEGTGRIIHPGSKTLPSTSQFSSYFEGNNTPVKLMPEVLSPERIFMLYEEGLPDPEAEQAIQIKQTGPGKYDLLLWENGNYNLIRENGKDIPLRVSGCATILVTGSWKLSFPAEAGLPSIEIPELSSLHLHADFDIKHFSGTVTYNKVFHLTAQDLQADRQLFLDLGRVEVLAEVKVNGKFIGQVWKAPFRLNITDGLKPGPNQLEVSVTNLWANRLIGDEYLPGEQEYSSHGFIEKLPEWYTQNKPKPGQRKTFTVWKNFKKEDPLLESGLLGPVKIITAVKILA